MKKILTHLYNRIFKRNKSFIVWSDNQGIKFNCIDFIGHSYIMWFTYTIYHYPNRSNKYKLKCTPRSRQFESPRVYAKETVMYQTAISKLSEFQREELIDLIKLPTIEGINIK